MKAKASKTKGETAADADAARLIDGKIEALGGWRGETLSKIRKLIKSAVPDVVETVKWRKPMNPSGVPVWEKGGIICTGETYKDKVKLTFAKGAALEDRKGLFNSSLEGGVRRAIDFLEGDKIDEPGLKALFKAAAKLNAG